MQAVAVAVEAVEAVEAVAGGGSGRVALMTTDEDDLTVLAACYHHDAPRETRALMARRARNALMRKTAVHVPRNHRTDY